MHKLFPFLLLFLACSREQISLPRFQEIPLPVSADLSAVCFSDSLHGIISGGQAWASGFLLSSIDGGLTWAIDTSTQRKLEDVGFDPTGRAYACGQDASYFKEPGGQHWQPIRIDFQWLRALHFPSQHYGAMVSGEGFHSGQLRVFGPQFFWWQDTVHEVIGELEAVWFADPRVILAVGAGWVIRSSDAGQSWERLMLTGDFFTDVHFPDANTGYICGNNGSILKSVDGGLSWRYLREGGAAGRRNKGFRALWFSTVDTGWLLGDGGIFWHTENGGKTWKQVAEAPLDADYSDVFVLNGKGWATAKNGRFFVFEN